MAGSYFATSLTFIFYLFKDCVCSPGCSLSRPLVATAGDGSEGIAIHSKDWWLRWESGHWTGLHGLSWQPAEWPAQVSWLVHITPWSSPADNILPLRPRTFSGLTLPTLTFCGSSTPKLSQRSSWWACLQESLFQLQRTWDISLLHICSLPYRYLSKSSASEAKSNPELTWNPAQNLSALFPLSWRVIPVSLLPLLGCGSSKERSTPLCHSPEEFALLSLLNCLNELFLNLY